MPKGYPKLGYKIKHIYFLDICLCGCNEIVYGNHMYLSGHQNRVKKNWSKFRTKEWKEKMSKSMSGSNNHRYGKPPWNKGKPFMKLEKHPLWRGGISYLPYCIKFNNKLKEEIRERDSHTCQLCNKTQEQNKQRMDVHHIHYDKKNCYPDLICLCKICNIKVNFNRSYYESLFMNKLNDRNLLFWTRRREENK